MVLPSEHTAPELPHKLTLDTRRKLSMSGVLDVESFDESMICLTTTRGPLTVRGAGLHLQELRLGGGEILIDGQIDSLTYEEDAPTGGFFARLFG